jgi:hypothetical protein
VPAEDLQARAHEATLFVQRVAGPATLEAIAAFKEKRKPNFDGKD